MTMQSWSIRTPLCVCGHEFDDHDLDGCVHHGDVPSCTCRVFRGLMPTDVINGGVIDSVFTRGNNPMGSRRMIVPPAPVEAGAQIHISIDELIVTHPDGQRTHHPYLPPGTKLEPIDTGLGDANRVFDVYAPEIPFRTWAERPDLEANRVEAAAALAAHRSMGLDEASAAIVHGIAADIEAGLRAREVRLQDQRSFLDTIKWAPKPDHRPGEGGNHAVFDDESRWRTIEQGVQYGPGFVVATDPRTTRRRCIAAGVALVVITWWTTRRKANR